MLHAMQFGSGPVPAGLLRAMFIARKRVFADLLKWDVPVIDGQFEVDQFDDAHATYLVLGDDRHDHLASARLLPTVRPHILDSFYPDLCEIPLPRGPEVHEVTRFCLDRRLRACERRTARDALVHGLANHALAIGIDRYTAIAEVSWFEQIATFGWDCKALGRPRSVDGAMLVAFEIAIDDDTPAKLDAAGIARGATNSDIRAAA